MPSNTPALSGAQIAAFITDGFVRIDNAFPSEIAARARAILWRDTGCDPDDPATWTKPVIRLGGYSDPPFRQAANTPVLQAAYDQLAGPGNWLPLQGLGTFPVRFPSSEPPGDDGWHVDMSFLAEGDDPGDILGYRINLASRGRALLMLFLFSDVDENDAPTRIRVGSHRDIARELAAHGAAGASLRTLAETGFESSARRPEVMATGRAGTVYLCHPFLVHAAQPHRGANVRFLAQPPLLPRHPFDLRAQPRPPAVQAIVEALETDNNTV